MDEECAVSFTRTAGLEEGRGASFETNEHLFQAEQAETLEKVLSVCNRRKTFSLKQEIDIFRCKKYIFQTTKKYDLTYNTRSSIEREAIFWFARRKRIDCVCQRLPVDLQLKSL